MKVSPLFGPWAKVERSKAQIYELNIKIRALFARHPYEIVSKVNPEGTEETWRFNTAGAVPAELAVITGEILHNLRSALDNLTCATAFQHKGSTSGTYFPFGATAQIFEEEIARKCKKLPVAATDMIRALKPYKGGNDLLWAIHAANITDKHVDLIAVNFRTIITLETLIFTEGAPIIVGPRSGRHFIVGIKVPDVNQTNGVEGAREFLGDSRGFATAIYDQSGNGRDLVQPENDRQPEIIFEGDGMRVAFDAEPAVSGDDDREFITTTRGAKFQGDFKPTFDIAFRDVEIIKRQPLVAALDQMRDLVEGILVTFERRFF
jgi:hypothetical protein